jgi:4-amino-4-deoxy-L-arabinose transferase-like glycosyltransferase
MSVQRALLRSGKRAQTMPWVVLSYLALAAIALPLRVLDLGGSLTVDEMNYWITRSETFLRAIGSADFAATAIAGHPGVTTMWLGSAGIVLRRALLEAGWLHDGSFPTLLMLYRLPVALAHVASILLGYGLLRRMLPIGTAALAALLWATDPFLLGYSRVLHVDALAASFGTLSLLAACVYWNHAPRPWLLIGSGICAGLAVLSKFPALALAPVVGLLALAAWRQDDRPKTKDEGRRLSFALRPSSLVSLLVWGAAAVLTALALWPALWAAPARVYALVQQAADLVAQPHDQGNFFFGREDATPGPLFYPVALVLRLTPWALLGLLPLARRRVRGASSRDLAALACFVVLLIVGLSLSPKKFNRYLIPAIPAVDMLAAVGIAEFGWWMLDWLIPRVAPLQTASKIGTTLLAGVALLAIVNAASWHPYGIAYYNPLLGGAQAGANTFLTGWGEGLDLVADWLNAQPDITGVVTASTATTTLRPYMRRGAQAYVPEGQLPEHAGYVVVYIRHAQQGGLWPPFDSFYGKAIPLEIISIHGVPYAWIYQAPPAVEQQRPADFGDTIHLLGFDGSGDLHAGGQLALKLVWTVQRQPAADYTLFAHLIGPDGQRYAQVDLPYATSAWRPGRFVTTELPLALPPGAPRGEYQLFVGLYDPATGQRLPLSAQAREPALDGANALLLYQGTLR